MKTCPFCGGNASLMRSIGKYKYFIFVKCNMCGAQAKAFVSKDDPAEYDWDTYECEQAVQAWDMRNH